MMKAFGSGRFVADPQLRKVGDTHVCEFSLACNEYRKTGGEKKKIVSFLDFQVWDRGAEVIAEYCRKGDSINVWGTIRQDRWEDSKTGQKRSKNIIRVDEFELVGGRKPEGEVAPQEDEQDKPLATEGVPF